MQRPSVRQILIWLIAATIIACILIIFLFIWRHGRLALTLPAEARHIAVFQQSDNTQVVDETIEEGAEDYSKLLATGKYEVRVSSENNEKLSSYFVEIHTFLQTTERETALFNQANRHKIGRGASACPVLSGTELYSYSCAGATELNKVKTLYTENVPELETTPFSNIIDTQSYKDGALILTTETYLDEQAVTPVLSYFKDGEVQQRKTLPEELFVRPDDAADYQLRINSTDPTKFIVTRDGNRLIYAFDSFADDGTRYDIEEENAIPTQFTSAMQYSGNDIINVIGAPDVGHNQPEDGVIGDDGILDSNSVTVKRYTLSGDTIEQVNEYNFTDLSVENVFMCTPKYICLQRESTFEVYSLGQENPVHILSLYDAVNHFTTVDDENFIYANRDGVFLLDMESLASRQIYHSSNFRISGFFTSPQGIILNAFHNTDRERSREGDMYTFLIETEEPAESNAFIDDKLPYAQGAVDGAVLASDFYQNTIVVQVALESWEAPVRASGGGASGYTYSQAEFDEKRQRILQQLEQDGFTEEDYTIRIIP